MLKNKTAFIIFALVSLQCLAYDGPAKKHAKTVNAKENKAISANEIRLINDYSETSDISDDEDDFVKIRRKQYGSNTTKQFYYPSRWHAYLNEVAEEKQREREHDRAMASYEREVKRINAENERIREYNANIQNDSYNSSSSSVNAREGSSVSVTTIGDNRSDSKKD